MSASASHPSACAHRTTAKEGAGGYWDEEHRKSASRQCDPQEVAVKAFQRALCLMLRCFQETEQVKALERSLIRSEKEMKVEANRQDPVHLDKSNSSRAVSRGGHGVEQRRNK